MPSEAWGLSSEHYLLGSQESSRDCTIGSCSMPMKPMTTEPGKLARLPILGIPRGPPLRELSGILSFFFCVGLRIPQCSLLEA